MSFKQRIIETNYWPIRLALSILLLAGFLLAFFLGGGLLFFKPAPAVIAFADEEFEIHFIDVGQGDSIFIRFPDKRTMLVDCGPNDKDNNVVSYIDDFFRQENIKQLDYFVLTHQDADHVGKGAEIFAKFEVKNFYRPKIRSKSEDEPAEYRRSTTATYDNIIKAAYEEPFCSIIYNEKDIEILDKDLEIKFLSPAKDVYGGANEFNDYSPMIMVTYRDKKFLLTGDGETEAEQEVIAGYGNALKADVLKVAHHGSKSSTSTEFLSYVQPEYAVISVGKDNQFGHPTPETLSRLAGSKILQTAQSGTIAISVTENGIEVFTSSQIFIIDVPLLFVIFATLEIVVWGVKIKRKPKKAQE